MSTMPKKVLASQLSGGTRMTSSTPKLLSLPKGRRESLPASPNVSGGNVRARRQSVPGCFDSAGLPKSPSGSSPSASPLPASTNIMSLCLRRTIFSEAREQLSFQKPEISMPWGADAKLTLSLQAVHKALHQTFTKVQVVEVIKSEVALNKNNIDVPNIDDGCAPSTNIDDLVNQADFLLSIVEELPSGSDGTKSMKSIAASLQKCAGLLSGLHKAATAITHGYVELEGRIDSDIINARSVSAQLMADIAMMRQMLRGDTAEASAAALPGSVAERFVPVVSHSLYALGLLKNMQEKVDAVVQSVSGADDRAEAFSNAVRDAEALNQAMRSNFQTEVVMVRRGCRVATSCHDDTANSECDTLADPVAESDSTTSTTFLARPSSCSKRPSSVSNSFQSDVATSSTSTATSLDSIAGYVASDVPAVGPIIVADFNTVTDVGSEGPGCNSAGVAQNEEEDYTSPTNADEPSKVASKLPPLVVVCTSPACDLAPDTEPLDVISISKVVSKPSAKHPTSPKQVVSKPCETTSPKQDEGSPTGAWSMKNLSTEELELLDDLVADAAVEGQHFPSIVPSCPSQNRDNGFSLTEDSRRSRFRFSIPALLGSRSFTPKTFEKLGPKAWTENGRRHSYDVKGESEFARSQLAKSAVSSKPPLAPKPLPKMPLTLPKILGRSRLK